MKRQANALTAVLENWQDVENAIDIYANSAGSALRENEIYLDSWEAKSKAVGAAWNEFVNSFINSEWIKGFLDGAQETLSFLTKTEAAISVLAGVISGVLVGAVLKGTFTVEGFNAAILKANILSGCIPMLIGGLVALAGGIISWGISASDTAKQIENLTTKIEEQQQAIDELSAKEKEATDLYKEYASLMSKSNAYGLTADEKENLLNISNQLVDTYGLEVQGIDAVTGAYVIGTSAINDYVEALRAERLEKQKEQNDTRNDRIDKNVGKIEDLNNKNINDNLSMDEKFWVSGNWAQAESKNEKLLELIGINDKKPWWLNDTSFYRDKLRENYDTLLENYEKVMASDVLNDEEKSRLKKWAEAYASEKSKITSEIQAIANSIVKDVITNIQVENADTMTQSGESVLTTMLQTILPNIEDLDEDKVKEIQDKVNEFAKSYGRAFNELGTEQQKIQEKIKNNTAGLTDYKDLLDNQMKQLQVVEQIFGATSEEANAFREQLNKSIENNTGLYFANISKTMSESDLDTSEFDKVTSAILKLDGAMANGEITFSEYVDELNKNLDNISLESTFQGDENAAKSFFAVLNDKGKKAIQNLMAQYQNGEISQKDYLSGITDMVDYFENLSNQATLMLGVDSSELSETIDGLKEAQNELNNFKSVIQTIPDTFEEFKNGGVSSVSALTSALEKAGITSMEIGGKVRNTSKEIAQAMQENAENFAEAKEKIADDFRKNLTTIGKNLAVAVNKMIEIFGEVKIVIDPPDVSLWDWLKAMFTGKTEEMVFGVKIDGEADPESWGKHFGDLAGELDWGFDDFTGGGGNPPPYTPPGDNGKDKDKPDYEDPTDAIIDRINLRHRELEQQEESIQNAIEIAELEKDYKKQISLTNDLIDKRKERLTELKNANWWHHNEAEWLRTSNLFYDKDGNLVDTNTWFNSLGEETEAYKAFYNSQSSKEEQERIKNFFENISKYKKAYMENAEEITALNKEILQDEQKISDIYKDVADEIDRYYNRIIKEKQDEIDYIDALIEKEEALYSIKEKSFEALNSMSEARREIDKDIRLAQQTKEYLNGDISIFDEEDYAILSSTIEDINAYIQDQTENFTSKIQSLGEDEMYLAETITEEYERRVALKEQELELVKAEINLKEKRTTLENILAEKNVWVIKDGKKQWTYNLDKARQAMEDVADAEANYESLVEKQSQQLILDAANAHISGLNIQKGALEQEIKGLEEASEVLSTALEDLINPVKDFGSLIETIIGFVGEDIGNKLRPGGSGGSSGGSGGSSGGSGGYKIDGKKPVAWVPSVGEVSVEIVDGKTQNELPVDSIVNTGDGNYYQITGGTAGNYDSKPVSKEDYDAKVKPYAEGTNKTKAGLALMGEKEFEAYISSSGELIPINQPTLGNIPAGGIVFNQDQMANLRSLWDLSSFNRASLFNSTLPEFVGNKTLSDDHSVHVHGDINVKNEADFDGFVKDMTDALRTKGI